MKIQLYILRRTQQGYLIIEKLNAIGEYKIYRRLGRTFEVDHQAARQEVRRLNRGTK